MTKEQILNLAQGKPITYVGIPALAFAGGVAVGYLLISRRLRRQYKLQLDQEISEMKTYYSARYKHGEYASPQEVEKLLVKEEENLVPPIEGLDEEAMDMLRRYSGQALKTEPEEEIVHEDHDGPRYVIVRDDRTGDVFDYEEEIKLRTPDHPYIITIDEFNENEEGHEQVSLSYYAGDRSLADEKEELIPDVERVVGVANLSRFGHGSSDPNVVYIRNERLDLDMEITLSQGKYSVEVLGFIEHGYRHPSRNRKEVRKFRGDDE